MISIIIPTHNRLELLKLTLANLLNQTHAADEIIVIDDHSKDKTVEYLSANFSNKIIVLKSKKNGPGAARNLGLTVATGHYIQFFDSDDLMTLNKLEDQLSIIKSCNQGMVYGPYIPASYENGKWHATDAILQYSPFSNNETFRTHLLRGWNAITQSCLFDANLIKDVGNWREDLMTHEDKEYLFRLSAHIDYPAHTNKSAVIYRQHNAQITDSQTRLHTRTQNHVSVLLQMREETDWKKESLFTKLRFRGKLDQALNYLQYLESENKVSTKSAIQLVEQLRNKYERLRTHTNWERMHGPNADPEQFQHYLDLL